MRVHPCAECVRSLRAGHTVRGAKGGARAGRGRAHTCDAAMEDGQLAPHDDYDRTTATTLATTAHANPQTH